MSDQSGLDHDPLTTGISLRETVSEPRMAPEQRIELTLRQLDLALAVCAQLMHRLHVTTVVLDSFQLEVGMRVSITPNKVTPDTKDKHYYVKLRESALGS